MNLDLDLQIEELDSNLTQTSPNALKAWGTEDDLELEKLWLTLSWFSFKLVLFRPWFNPDLDWFSPGFDLVSTWFWLWFTPGSDDTLVLVSTWFRPQFITDLDVV